MHSIEESMAMSKNTEIIGISVGAPIKTISGSTSPAIIGSNNLTNGSSLNAIDQELQVDNLNNVNNHLSNNINNNNHPINPSLSPSSDNSVDQNTMNNGTNLKLEDNFEIDDRRCGWFKFRPKYLEMFMSPKWALFWLCCASWTQGEYNFAIRFSWDGRRFFCRGFWTQPRRLHSSNL